MRVASVREAGPIRKDVRGPVNSPRRMWLTACAVCAVGAFLAFVVPLYVPEKPAQTVSASYLAGFNNSVAIVSSAGLSVLVLLCTLWSFRRNPANPFQEGRRLSRRFIAGVISGSTLVLALSGWLVALSHLRYLGDAGYIIEQASVRQDTGRALYTQIEFAYGPLLLFPEIWISQLLRCSITTSYFVTLIFESSLGLAGLAYVLNELPIDGALRKIALVLLAIGAITPHLGLNYTFFRFVSPLAILLFATRGASLWRCTLLLSAGEIVGPLISPEVGLALGPGILTFGLLRAWQQGWRWLAAAILPLAALGALLLAFGRPYLKMAASFSRGALNLPVGPYPHILVLLFALIWLVPFGLGQSLKLDQLSGTRLLAMYATSLALMPAALGRCDPLHVLFDGVGILVLSLIAVSQSSYRIKAIWVGCIAALVLWNHYVNETLFEIRTADVLQRTVMPHLPPLAKKTVINLSRPLSGDFADELAQEPDDEFHLDIAKLDQLVGSAPIATPLEITPTVEAELKASGHYSPEYYAFWVDMMNSQAERRSIEEVNTYSWVLLPSSWQQDDLNLQRPQDAVVFQGLDLPYRQRNPVPYFPGAAFAANLEQHWIEVQHFGPYALYQHKPGAPK